MATKERINFGKLTDQQAAFLEVNEWYLEADIGDEDRIRVVYPKLLAVSKWFSRRWNPVKWEFIRPIN